MTDSELGRIQTRIMNVLWESEKATAREITDELKKYEPIDHKNVQTILRRLEKKGAVSHDIDDRTFIYYPLMKDDNYVSGQVRNFIDSTFQGSVKSLVSALVESDDLSLDELKKIIDIVDDKEK